MTLSGDIDKTTCGITKTGGLVKMKDYIEKAKILIEALPYIKNFNGKISYYKAN